MARLPFNPAVRARLLEESLRPNAGTKVFHTAADFAAGAPKGKQYKRRDFSSIADKFVGEIESFLKLIQTTGDARSVWGLAKPEHVVALFAVMHREVYGVLPGELAGDWMAAVSSVKKLLKDELDNDIERAVDYLQWAFAREKKKFKRNAESTWRLGWRWTFMKREILTDWRVAIERAARQHR